MLSVNRKSSKNKETSKNRKSSKNKNSEPNRKSSKNRETSKNRKSSKNRNHRKTSKLSQYMKSAIQNLESKLIFPKIKEMKNDGRYKSQQKMNDDLIQAIHYFNSMGKQKGRHIWTPDRAGDYTISHLYLSFLFHKYNVHCKPLNLRVDVEIFDNEEKEEKELNNIKKVVKKIIECIHTQSKLIVVELDLYLPFGAHSNVIIIRPELNLIEYFEPHGKFLDVEVEAGFKNKNGSIKYLPTEMILSRFFNIFLQTCNEEFQKNNIEQYTGLFANSTCPYDDGLQAAECQSEIERIESIEDGGYCQLWSFFIVHMVLLNPSRAIADIYRIIYSIFRFKGGNKLKNDYLRHIAYGYSRFINDIMVEYFSKYLDMNNKFTLEYIKLLHDNDNKSEFLRLRKNLKDFVHIHGDLLMEKDVYSSKRPKSPSIKNMQEMVNELEKGKKSSAMDTYSKNLVHRINEKKRIIKMIQDNIKKMKQSNRNPNIAENKYMKKGLIKNPITGKYYRNPLK